jgi:NitT/TauT family transport system substrate-binding protein
MTITILRRLALAAAVALLLAACGGGDGGGATTVRLGYFPNVTHAPAIVGHTRGFFADALGADVDLQVQYFNAGPDVIQAMFNGGLDLSFIGPNPAINGYAQSNGEAIRIIAGSTSGGAFLVVRSGITAPEDLTGATIATPQLGNTQDVALRAWLITQGLSADTAGGGDVSIRPQSNADTLNAFRAGEIDGAWVPEPWATRLILEGGGVVLVDERELWPDGLYVTTHLIVRTEFLEQNPAIVEAFLEGYLAALEFVQQNPDEAQAITNDGIEAITSARLADATIAGAWRNLTFTWDPIASSLRKSADDAVAAGLLDPVDLSGIYNLDILNALLAEAGREPVAGL